MKISCFRIGPRLLSEAGQRPTRDSKRDAVLRGGKAALRATVLTLPLWGLGLIGCGTSAAPQAAQQPRALPVKVMAVASVPVPQSDQYIATIKSRRSATITPQVDGNLVRIAAHSEIACAPERS